MKVSFFYLVALFLSYPPGYYSYTKARRQKEKNAFEAKVQEMKRKDVEAEG